MLPFAVRRSVLVLAAVLTAPLCAQESTIVRYTLRATTTQATNGLIPLEVDVDVMWPSHPTVVFEVPVWTPGSYRLRDFPERITPLSATAEPKRPDKRDLPIQRLSRTAWAVEPGDAVEISFRYRVDLKPGDRFMDPADDRRCLTFEGPAVWLGVHDHLDAPCFVDFQLPEGWSVGTGLPMQKNYGAKDYDELVDCPVKLGVFQKFGFQAAGMQVDVFLDGGPKDLEFDSTKWLAGLQRIVEEGNAVFGGAPCERYAFLYTASNGGGGGGLEHLYSTAIGLDRRGFVRNPASSFGVSAHEFFHVYNVKRLRPVELGPFRYDRENRTTGLWLSEGVTSYYGAVLQARAGQQTPQGFWQGMGRAIATLENDHARHYTSSEMASWRVWDKQPSDRVVDYYGSGTVLGLLLDLQIRAGSHDTKSLDDALSDMWLECKRTGRGLTSEQIEQACTQAAGVDLSGFFAAHVRGTVVPDYGRILALAGLKYEAKERSRKNVLRGAELGRKQLAFRDWTWLEGSGGGDPLGAVGVLKKLDEVEVADGDAAQKVIDAAVLAGKAQVLVEYETAAGSRRSVRAALETEVQSSISVREDEQAPPEAVARRQAVTRARAAK